MDFFMEKYMDKVTKKISSPEATELEILLDSGLSTRELMARFFDMLMLKDRQRYLKENLADKANGYRERQMAINAGSTPVYVPRTRNSEFRPTLLPAPWKRLPQEMEELILSCLASGINKSKVSKTMGQMGLPVSDDVVSDFESTYLEIFKEINTKPLPENMLVLIADAKQVQITHEGKVQMGTIYSACGIDTQFAKDILGCEVTFEPENQRNWRRFFSMLINRGLKRVLLIITDAFSGITDITSDLFNGSDHQLCIVHLQRNKHKHLDKKDCKEFKEMIEQLKISQDFKSAEAKIHEICDRFKDKAPDFVKHIAKHASNYAAFANYPKDIRKHLHSSNMIEGINNVIEIKRKDIGGHFRSTEHFQINFAVIVKNLKQGKWKKIHLRLKEFQYELCQLFAIKFGVRP